MPTMEEVHQLVEDYKAGELFHKHTRKWERVEAVVTMLAHSNGLPYTCPKGCDKPVVDTYFIPIIVDYAVAIIEEIDRRKEAERP